MRAVYGKGLVLGALESLRRVAGDPEVQEAWRAVTLALKPMPICDWCKQPIQHTEARRTVHTGRHVSTAHVRGCQKAERND